MEGVEHLGQYVYEMTKAKVEALKNGDTGGDVRMAGTSGIAATGDEKVVPIGRDATTEEADVQPESALPAEVDGDKSGEPIKVDGSEEPLA